MISAIQTRPSSAVRPAAAPARAPSTPAAIVELSANRPTQTPSRPAESADAARRLLAQMTLDGRPFTVSELLGRLRTQNLDSLLRD